jgi:thiamine-monophosphate kinase
LRAAPRPDPFLLTTIGDIGEREILRRLRARIPQGDGVVVGLGDDSAAVELGGVALVTTDSLVEGVHFRREWAPPRLLGRKALSVNLSDIAAMAGVPRHATVSLVLPTDLPWEFVDELYDGLLERSAETGVNLVGGNLSAGPGVVIDVTLIGQSGRPVRRAGALPGDCIAVTGTLGAAAQGLKLLAQGARLDGEGALVSMGPWTDTSASAVTACLRAQLDPRPPLAFARALADRDLVHAAIDVSDGLSGDLWLLCEASGVAAALEFAEIPVDPQVSQLVRAGGGDALSLALHGGEDYQLLLAIPPDRLPDLRELAAIFNTPFTVLGRFREGEPSVFLRVGGRHMPVDRVGHDHFRSIGAPPT